MDAAPGWPRGVLFLCPACVHIRFLGRLVTEALLAEGREVVSIDHDCGQDWPSNHDRLRHVCCDRFGERERFAELVRGLGHLDAVVDLCCAHEAFASDVLQALTTSGGDGTAAGGARLRAQHYVLVSSDAVYWALRVPDAAHAPDGLEEDVADEFAQAEYERHLARCRGNPLAASQLRHGGAMLGVERTFEEASRSMGFDRTTLRIPDVYGPFDDQGAFWDLVVAVQEGRPVPALLPAGRVRAAARCRPQEHRCSWAFALDVRDAVLATLRQRSKVRGATLHVAHEEAATLAELAGAVAEALGLPAHQVAFDHSREASLPSTDFGPLNTARARGLLAPWRPTPLREAVRQAVGWWTSGPEHRRRHAAARPLHAGTERCRSIVPRNTFEVRRSMAGAAGAAQLARRRPLLLADALPHLCGQGAVAFVEALLAQAGRRRVECELRSSDGRVRREVHELRHVAGNLLEGSTHSASRRLESWEALAGTQLADALANPLGPGLEELGSGQAGCPRALLLGGAGARGPMRRDPQAVRWDCLLLGRRSWRLLPPGCALCGQGDVSPMETFAAGPTAFVVQDDPAPATFEPEAAWECEQSPGEAVLVPAGWWAQSYDHERVLSVAGRFAAPPREEDETEGSDEDSDEQYENVD
ncbi:unnamed protein product [Prorocentrum cordatum]|uniref:JmjC domain-containing protein n=1 Tax=Prorocentrum cordatum TaxID=2364126 RepID=A0ABN9YF02_9DINO|nr:unnamed protein product [Polarella glacialis]